MARKAGFALVLVLVLLAAPIVLAAPSTVALSIERGGSPQWIPCRREVSIGAAGRYAASLERQDAPFSCARASSPEKSGNQRAHRAGSSPGGETR